MKNQRQETDGPSQPALQGAFFISRTNLGEVC